MIDWSKHEDEVISCRKCVRLVSWREQIAQKRKKAYIHEEYWGKPVPGFGDTRGPVLIVGLAPGAHGSNRTGRMFTGDRSGDFLYKALFESGFANQSTVNSRYDGLTLTGVYISAVCRCAPPENKPTRDEIMNCIPFLDFERRHLSFLRVIVALGKIAYDHTFQLLHDNGLMYIKEPFSHGVEVRINNVEPVIIGSYHPSQQNTQTGRLTYPMFMEIWKRVNEILIN